MRSVAPSKTARSFADQTPPPPPPPFCRGPSGTGLAEFRSAVVLFGRPIRIKHNSELHSPICYNFSSHRHSFNNMIFIIKYFICVTINSRITGFRQFISIVFHGWAELSPSCFME